MNTNNNIPLSIVLPCYNEESHFEESTKKILDVLKRLDQRSEIIFVDDQSSDQTPQLINQLVDNFQHPQISLRKIFHPKNQGRGKAVSDGIKQARGELVGFLDIDLEVPAYYIPEFTRAIWDGADMAIGQRIYAMQLTTLPRWISSRGYNFLTRKFLGLNISDTEAGFKFFRRSKILPLLSRISDPHWFWDTEVTYRSLEAGLKVVEIPCLFLRRRDKKSTVKLWKDSWEYLVKLLRFKKKLDSERFWQKNPEGFEDRYQKSSFTQKFVTRFLTSRAQKINPLLTIKKRETLLDLGCGSGVYLHEALKKGALVTGVDYSQKTLELAQNRLAEFDHQDYQLVCASAEKLPLNPETFDWVLAIGLLDYVEDTQKVLQEIDRVLKPQGKLIVTVPNQRSPFWFLRTSWGVFLRKKLLNLPPILNWFSKEEFSKLLSHQGFTIEKIDQVQFTMLIFQCRKWSPMVRTRGT